jgi:hypothetical protein
MADPYTPASNSRKPPMPLGLSTQLDSPAAERIPRFLGLISAFSHLAGHRSRRKCLLTLPALMHLPLCILTLQDGSYIFVSEVKAELGNFSFVLSPHFKRRVDVRPNSLR